MAKQKIHTLLCYFLYLNLPWNVAKIPFIGIRSTHQEWSHKYMVIYRWQKDLFQPTSVNEDLTFLICEHLRTKCTAWVRKCFILPSAFVPCVMYQHPFHHFTQLSFHQLVLKETLSTRLGSRGINGSTVLGITPTLHCLSNRPLKDPSMCWTERMTRWTSSPLQKNKIPLWLSESMSPERNIPSLVEKLVIMKDI